jgi:hypothetical protein
VSESGPARAGDSVPPFLDSNVDINGLPVPWFVNQFIITASRTFLVRDAVTSILDECGGGRNDGRREAAVCDDVRTVLTGTYIYYFLYIK